MGRNRPDEDFAFEVVGRLLGAAVQPYDLGGRQNAVDALVQYADGRDDAVLEVSFLGQQDEARIRAVLGKHGHRRSINGANRLWHVQVPSDLTPAELDLIDIVLLRCEQQGIDRFPAQVLPLMQDADALALWGRGVTASSQPASAETPDLRAYVVVRGVGGPGGTGVEPLVEELADHLSLQRCNRRSFAAGGIVRAVAGNGWLRDHAWPSLWQRTSA